MRTHYWKRYTIRKKCVHFISYSFLSERMTIPHWVSGTRVRSTTDDCKYNQDVFLYGDLLEDHLAKLKMETRGRNSMKVNIFIILKVIQA